MSNFRCCIPALTAGERRALVDDALRRTGLTDFRGAYPKQLSGGMRQRVGIARALAVRPAILLMDEPLSALDSQTRELLLEDFIRLLGDGAMGAVYVTHNLEEAVRLADRIVVLSRRPGRVREIVPVTMTRAERGAHRRPRKAAGVAERAVVADPERGDRRRARGPACLTARRRRNGRPKRGRSRFAARALRRVPAVMPAGSRCWSCSQSGRPPAAPASSIRCSCRRRRPSCARSGSSRRAARSGSTSPRR